ncbi:hypothetical protein BRADI_1g57410v3 [Brachypodium distachyon]|uniref:MADS-box domain-containing protein n=1 Tax=Brachypodium distachyon TaxID=15368 RepID=A0A2K2DS21_BRADI|nr:hypothetical protein BRADI_1g57410v3 [Brachypodium distachyon]
MPRERRSGVVYIENDDERSVTFSKRRLGLFKGASDLAAVTGARVAIVLETDSTKMHSFGTPSADPIIHAFLSGVPPPEPLTDEVMSTRISWLQSEVSRLDRENTSEQKRKKLVVQRIKEIQQENPGMVANHLFSKDEDLNLEDLTNLFNELLLVQQGTGGRLPPLDHGHQQMIGGSSVSLNLVPPSVPLWGSDILPHGALPPAPSPSVPQSMLAPPFPVQVPQMLQPAPLVSTPPTDPYQLPELPPSLELPLQNYTSPYSTMDPAQNNTGLNSTFQHNVEESAQLVYSGGNAIVGQDPFGYDQWAYPLSDQPYYERFLEMDGNLGFHGTDVGQAHMGNDGLIDELAQSPSSGEDDDVGRS